MRAPAPRLMFIQSRTRACLCGPYGFYPGLINTSITWLATPLYTSKPTDDFTATTPMSCQVIVGVQHADASSPSRPSTSIPAVARIRGNSPASTLDASSASWRLPGPVKGPTRPSTAPYLPSRKKPNAGPSRPRGVLRPTQPNKPFSRRNWLPPAPAKSAWQHSGAGCGANTDRALTASN